MSDISVVRELSTEDAGASRAALRSRAVMVGELGALGKDLTMQNRLEVSGTQPSVLVV